MINKNLPKKMRMLLYGCKNSDCDELIAHCQRVLQVCGCKVDVTIHECNGCTVIDMSPCVQYIIKNGKSRRIYEFIPDDSPLRGKENGKKVRDKFESECRALCV